MKYNSFSCFFVIYLNKGTKSDTIIKKSINMRKLLSLVAVVMVTTFTFAQKTLVSDAAHSRIQFIVTHLGINDITGNLD